MYVNMHLLWSVHASMYNVHVATYVGRMYTHSTWRLWACTFNVDKLPGALGRAEHTLGAWCMHWHHGLRPALSARPFRRAEAATRRGADAGS